MNSESNRNKLEHSHAFVADTLKRTNVKEDDIVIKYEVLCEAGSNQIDEYFDLDGSSVAQKYKSHSHSNHKTLLSEVSIEESEFKNKTNHLEVEDNCHVVNRINLSVPANDDLADTNVKEILECHQNYEKMKTEEKICRFCLKMCCTFKTIDGDIRDVSNVLLPGIDLAAIQEPVICTHCEETLFMSFDFKTRYSHTRDYLIPFGDKKDDGVKLNLKDIYMTKNKNNISVLEDQDICGFCMCPAKNCSARFLDVGEGEVMSRNMLEQCLPELDLSIIEELVICAPCHVALENHSRFVTNVLIIEEKIKKYKASLDIKSKSQIDLSSLVHFVLSEVDGIAGDIIKLEKMFCDNDESADKEVEHKCNAVDIDDVKFINEQKFKPTSMLHSESKCNEIGMVKIQETFCAEDRTEFKEENIVEVEDQKILFDEEIDIKTDEFDFNRSEDGTAMTPLNARLNGKQEYSVLPSFKNNQLELHIDQTCKNRNITEITKYQYECGPFKTDNKFHLKTHLQKHKDGSEATIHKCDSCAYQTIHRSSLKRHLLRHKNLSDLIMHNCDSCAYQTIDKSALKSHLLKHKDISEVTMYRCVSCLYQTKYKSALKTHLLNHMNPSEVTVRKCDSCAYQTIHKSALKSHLLKHKSISEATMYRCHSCLYQTKHKSALKIHLLNHMNPSEVTVRKCDSCAYQTIYKSALKSHLLKHKSISEVTMYKCDSCLYQTKYKSTLKIHLLKHINSSKVTMHKCDSCAYQPIHKGDLKTHLLKRKNPSEETMH